MQTSRNKTKRELALELDSAHARLVELEDTHAALRTGEIDAIVVQGPKGGQVFTLEDPESPYRVLAEQMNEGAATLAADGTILFSNRRLAEMVRRPPVQLLRAPFSSMLPENQRKGLHKLLQTVSKNQMRVERELLREDGTLLPVQLSLSLVAFSSSDRVVCMVVTDLSELNHARRVLQQQSEAFDLANDAIVVRGMDDRIRSWNRGAAEIYGWSAEEAIGKVMSELLHTDFSDPLETIQRAFARTNGWQGEVRQLTRNGTALVLASRWSLLRDERGEPDAVLIINRDITQKNAGETALRESESRFRMLADLVPQIVWMCTPDGSCIYFNQRWGAYTGLSVEQGCGAGWAAAFHPDDRTRAWEAWSHSVSTGDSYRIESRLRRFDGTYRWFLMLGQPQVDGSGTVTQWFGTCTDIETSKLLEAEMQQSQRELRLRHKIAQRFLEVRGKEVFSEVLDLLLEATGSREGLFGVIEENGAIIYPSKTRIEDLFHADDALVHDAAGKWDEIWARAMLQKRTLYSNPAVGASGPPAAICRLMAVPILFHGELVGQIGIAGRATDYNDEDRDFLERVAVNLAPLLRTRILWNCEEVARKQAEKELQKLNKELDDRVQLRTGDLITLNKELEAFSYSVSHDLRAPLRHVDGFLTLLSKRSHSALDQPSQHYLQCALDASRRMGRLIDELLQFSRLGRSQISEEEVDLNSIIEDVRREMEPEMLDRKVVWKVTRLPTVAGDPPMLRQIFQNLIGNALKFTRPCPIAEISIGTEAVANGEVVFFVRDNGAGFDMKYYNKMFQVFQRLHSEKDFEGTGIGLAIVRRVVERQRGRVWAEGKVGAGATIYFALPSRQSTTLEGKNEIETHLAD
jgi:PAS domain S-box-containing protein